MGRQAPSAEEMLATASQNNYKPGAHKALDRKRHRGKHTEKTKKNQDGTLRRYVVWYLRQMREEYADAGLPPPTEGMARAKCLAEGASAPSLEDMKDFMRFNVSLSRPRILDKPTADSMNIEAEWFFAGFTRVTGTETEGSDRSEVYNWVRTTLVAEGLVVNVRFPKGLFNDTDLTRLLLTLWTKDDLGYIPERYRVQFSFITNVYCWTGARIGAFFNGSLCYKDIHLALQHTSEGSWELIYKIDQRWVKNNRDPENIVFGAAAKDLGKLLYSDVLCLLGMAFADNALFGYDTLADLLEQKIPPGEAHMALRWKDSALERPILRKCTMADGVTDEPMPKEAFRDIFKSTLKNSGYLCRTSIHMIRRALGKKVDESYTPAQRSQHLTQADPQVFGQYYMANCSSVNGQKAFRGIECDDRHIEYFQSLEKYREEGLPCTLPAKFQKDIENELLDLAREVETATTKAASSQAKRCLANARRTLKQKKLRQYQEQWIKDRRDWKILTRGKQSAKDPSKEDLFYDICEVIPERKRLAKLMVSDQDPTPQEKWCAVLDFCSLCTRDGTVLYLPQLAPVDGACPERDCGLLLDTIPKRQRQQHILSCVRRQTAHRLNHVQAGVHYCYHCFTWVVGDDWDSHCWLHLVDLRSKRCGTATYCHTLLRPAHCPFCLGDHNLAPSARMESWTREHQLRKHLQGHMDACRWPAECPHPLCDISLADSAALTFHFIDDHHISLSHVKASSSQKSDATDDTTIVANVKRMAPDQVWLPYESLETYSTSDRPAKRVRSATPTICPRLITSHSTGTSTPVDEDPFWEQPDSTCTELSSHHDDELAQQAMSLERAGESLGNDLFDEFIRSPSPSSDYSGETVVSVNNDHDTFANQNEKNDRSGSLQEGEIEGVRRAIRIRFRVQPQVTLRLRRPAATKGRVRNNRGRQ